MEPAQTCSPRYDGPPGSDARNMLVMRYSPAIRSYVRAMTKNDEEADELSQDVVVADPQR